MTQGEIIKLAKDAVVQQHRTMKESQKRTFARMISYRITAWIFTVLWTYLITKDVESAAEYATALHALLSIDYYIHERIWLRIKWGIK